MLAYSNEERKLKLKSRKKKKLFQLAFLVFIVSYGKTDRKQLREVKGFSSFTLSSSQGKLGQELQQEVKGTQRGTLLLTD